MIKSRRWFSTGLVLCTLLIIMQMLALPAQAALTDTNIGASISGSTDSSSIEGTAISASVRTGYLASTNKNYTITLTNNSGAEATLSFVYSFTNSASNVSRSVKYYTSSAASAASVSLTSGSTFKQTLQAGGKVEIYAEGGNGATVTTNLTDITLKIKTAADVTFAPDSTVSYTVGYVDADGASQTATVTAGGSNVTVEAELSEGFVITPTTDGYACESATGTTSGTVYVGGNGAFTFAKNETVTPVFISSSAVKPFTHLGVNKTYHNLNAAANAGSGTVVLNQDYTLPTGDYTIPYGVILLIPCDDANTVYTTQPGDNGADYYEPTSVYRKLTMANGANITVDGAISIGGEIGTNMTGEVVDTKYYYTNGAPSGPLGYIAMNGGSDITVNSGGNLYAWGFVTGSGAVTVKSGGTIYEDLQIRDWRGGNCTSSVVDGKDTYEVFPFSQYYIQNVEVPLTIEAGATQNVCTALSVTLVGAVKQNAVYLGSNSGLIRLSSGSLTRTYDGSADRIIYDLDGDISFANLNITVQVSMFGTVTINSEDYMMPLNGNMTLHVSSGSNVTVGQDFALLPGAIVEIEDGATVTMSSGKRFIAYGSAQWGTYCSASNYKFNAVYFAPGRTYTRTANDLVDAKIVVDGTLDATNGYLYTTSDGANVTSGGANVTSNGGGVIKTAKGSQTVTYQITQSDTTPNYQEIAITPAKLLNGDSTYVATADSTTSPNTYTYTNGKWICATHTWNEGTVTTAATCTTAGSKLFTCTVCGSTKTEEVAANGHTYGTVSYTWTDYTACVASHTCTVSGCGHSETANATITSAVTKAATCKEAGEKTYTATFSVDWAEKQTKTETIAIDSTAHTAKDAVQENGTAATCGEAGSYESVVYCSACNAEMSRTKVTVAATGEHNYSSEVTEPTCTEQGYTTHTCTVCGNNYKDTYVDALGHTEVTDAAVAPTCTATGLTEGKHCSVCNEVLTAQTVVDALGHTEVIDAAVAPTCTATGLTEGKHCSVCDEVLVAQTEVAANGHTEVTDAAVAATCTATGLTEGKHCSVCNEVLVAQTVVDALGHTEVVDEAVAPTCTETGLTEGKHCSVCSEVLVAQTVVDALGHTEVIDAAVAPTCTTTGLTEGKHCSVCSEVLVAQTVVDALGHTEVIDAAVAATCTATGLTEGKHCSVCSEVLVAQTVVDALGHTEVIDAAVAPTCTATGLTEGKHCSVCNEVLVAQTEVASLGHTEVIDVAVAATCTATGLTEGSHCSACNEVLVAQTVVDALGHTEVIDAAVAPTCTATGLTEGKHCSVCNEVIVAQTVVAALGHTEVIDAAVAATCTATGLTEGSHCSVCNEVLVAQTVVDAKGHTEVIDEAVAPTCTTTGLTEGKHCSVCNEVLVAQTEAASLGHTEVIDVAVAATCTATGLTEGKHCSVCNEVLVAQTVVAALGHTEVIDAAVAATCTATGLTEGKHCSVCNEVIVAQTAVDALGHTEVIDVAVAATCTATGLTEGKHCSVCNEVLLAQEVVSVKGHSYNSVVTAPTCEAGGYTTYTCSVCGDTYTADEVEATGHINTSVSYAPVDGEKKHTVTTKCSCGEVVSTTTAECSDGEDVDTNCDVCGADLGTPITTFTPTIGNGTTTTEWNDDGTVTFLSGEYASTYITVVGPASGWVLGSANTFTVSSTNNVACVVIVKDENGDYTKVNCETEDGVHSFTIDGTFTAKCEIIVAIKGDADGNGFISTADNTEISRSLLPSDGSNKRYKALSKLGEILADADGNGFISTADNTEISRSLLPSDGSNKRYKPIEW